MTTQGVGDVQDVNTLVSLQIQLARIEETLKPLAAFAGAVTQARHYGP